MVSATRPHVHGEIHGVGTMATSALAHGAVRFIAGRVLRKTSEPETREARKCILRFIIAVFSYFVMFHVCTEKRRVHTTEGKGT